MSGYMNTDIRAEATKTLASALPLHGMNTLPYIHMPKSSADPVIVANIVGAILIGVEFQALSYGVVCVLAWQYTHRSQGDSWWLKGLMFFAWCICTFSLCLTSHALYFFTVKNFGNMEGLEITPWSINLFMVVNASVVFLVRLVFMYRLLRFCKNTNRIGFAVITGMIFTGILSLTVLTGSAAVSARLFIASHQRQRIKRIKLLLEIIFSTGVSADILLTALLCVFLNGSRSGLKRTDSAINILILYAIETGLFPGIIEGAGMVAYFAKPRSFIYVVFYVQTANLYFISLLASLNARALVRRFIESPITVNFTVLDDDPPHSASSASPTRISTSACSGTSTIQLHADEETLHTRLAGDIKKAGMPELEVVEKELLGGTGFPGIIPVLDLEGGSAPGYARDVIVYDEVVDVCS